MLRISIDLLDREWKNEFFFEQFMIGLKYIWGELSRGEERVPGRQNQKGILLFSNLFLILKYLNSQKGLHLKTRKPHVYLNPGGILLALMDLEKRMNFGKIWKNYDGVHKIPFITLSFNPEANISFVVKLKFKIVKIPAHSNSEIVAFWSKLNGFARGI